MAAFENSVWGILIVFMLMFIVVNMFSGGNKYKDDPDEVGQRKIAREILRGNTTVDDVVKNDNYDPAHVEQWVKDYTKLAIEYALDAEKHTHELELKEQDLQWFEKACEKHIGPDWRDKTDYNNRRVSK